MRNSLRQIRITTEQLSNEDPLSHEIQRLVTRIALEGSKALEALNEIEAIARKEKSHA